MNNIVGRRIRDARIAKKITQRSLAKDAEISTSYMNLIESGRRPIAGNLLKKIAIILDVDSSQLSDDVSASLVAAIWPLLADQEISKTEVEELLIGHPKWGRMIQSLGNEIDALKVQLNEVTNSLSLDSGFSETFHELLSRISSIRSTASILNTQGDLAKEKDSQFRNIIHTEARNASIVAKRLMANFEETSRTIGSDASTLQMLSSKLFADQYYIPFLEDCAGSISKHSLIESINANYGDATADSPSVLRLFFTLAKDIELMPATEFLKAAKKFQWDIESLSVNFSVPIDRVLRRIAMLSQHSQLPRVSLNIYDQMGNVWLMSPISDFSGYKKIGCAYWPIFDFHSGIDRLISQTMEIGSEDEYQAFAAHGLPNTGNSNRSHERISTMISYPITAQKKISDITIQAHIDCSLCNKIDCNSRRNRSLFAENNSTIGKIQHD